MGSLVDYDVHFKKGRGQCGPPSAQFRTFFEQLEGPRRPVLDLGCGQGRDALLAASLGHPVVGVDLSRQGVAQMMADAREARLPVLGVVADVLAYRSRRRFGVVLLDRVLHLLLDDADRKACLARASGFTAVGGHLLIADTARNGGLIRRFFNREKRTWKVVERAGNFLHLQRKRRG